MRIATHAGAGSVVARAIAIGLVGALLAGGVTACRSPGSASGGTAWATSAEQFVAALHQAYATGFANAMAFYAPQAHVDQRGILGYEGTGRGGFAQALRDTAQWPPTWIGGRDTSDWIGFSPTEPLYLSGEGFLDASRITHPELDPPPDVAIVDTVTGAVISDELLAVSARTGGGMGEVDQSAIDPIAFGYVEAWASGDPRSVRSRYAPGATLRDSLAGVDLEGAAAIAAAASQGIGQGGLRGATLRHIPDGGGPAYYENGGYNVGPVDQLVVLMDLPGEGGCPGAVASVLWLDGDMRITREQRYHRIDAIRRCVPADQRPTGWWDTAHAPSAPTIRRTGTIDPGPWEIAVWNGSPGLQGLIGWARRRFADAGLPPPQPTSITFLPPAAGDRWRTYGLLTATNAPDLGLPFSPAEACPVDPCLTWPTWVKAATLHELAHLWIVTTPTTPYDGPPTHDAGGPRVARFLAHHDLPWYAGGAPWGEQGAERAAETITWGLMDEPYTIDARLGAASCADLAADFARLTYTTPDLRACATPANGGAP